MSRQAPKILCKFAPSLFMKRFLLILLCLSASWFFRPEALNAAPHVSSAAYGSKAAYSAGVLSAEAPQAAETSRGAVKQKKDAEVPHAARAGEPSSPRSFMDPELLALLLLIMVLGMLYTNPSR